MKEIIHVARYASHGGSNIDGVTHWGYKLTPIKSTDPGAADAPGDAETIITHYSLTVTLYSQDDNALIALIGAAASNAVLGYKASAGANRKKTIKNVYFDDGPSQVEAPAKDSGGKVPVFSITGTAQWGASDTPALMIVDAAEV